MPGRSFVLYVFKKSAVDGRRNNLRKAKYVFQVINFGILFETDVALLVQIEVTDFIKVYLVAVFDFEENVPGVIFGNGERFIKGDVFADCNVMCNQTVVNC